MKKSILTTLFIFIIAKALCQTMTFSDLQHMLTEKNKDQYLRAKGFNVLSSRTNMGHTVTYYVIHSQSPQTETVIVGTGVTTKNGSFLQEVAYTNKDRSYVYSLIKQITKAGFNLTKKKPGKKWDTYRFDNNDLFTQVFIQHGNSIPSSVNIRHKVF